jgi:ABC-2 type transport system permease protein
VGCVERSDWIAKMAFFPLFIGIFSALWRAIAESKMPLDLPPKQLVWYLAATEWVLFSVPHPERDIEQLVRRGDIAYELTRPVSFLGAKFAQGQGTLLLQSPAFALAAFGSAWLFSGDVPEHPLSLLWIVPFGLLATEVLFVFQLSLALGSFWFQSVAPLGWIWSKATFVLGGLMLPLTLYPDWLQRVAWSTPFPCLIYGPASFLLEPDAQFAVSLLMHQLGWLFVACVVTLALYRSAVEALTIHGG